MIIVNLAGGLGNQLFQYANGRRLSLKLGVPLRLDARWFTGQSLRSFRLGVYGLDKLVALPQDLAIFTSRSLSYRLLRRVCRTLEFLSPGFYYRTINENSTGHNPVQFDHQGNLYLVGYWQSEKYIKEIHEQLVADLVPITHPDAKNAALLQEIDNCKSVSLHVRRGDYVMDPYTTTFHGALNIDYYVSAIRKILENIEDAHFFIFSDDLPWCMKSLNIPASYTFVDINGPEQDFEDLRLMAACRHHIIANSTFSWWGAWLSRNPDKIVIAPARWFNNKNQIADDLIPADWIKL